jgi:DNA-binding response OmpR family regulator
MKSNPATTTAASHRTDLSPHQRRAVRVLVIDDDVTALECYQEMLAAQGYSVCTAESVADGLASAAAQNPDVVLLDLHMPMTDGLEGLRQLRAEPLHLEAPVAILTGDYFLDEQVGRDLRDLGAGIHFKPVWDSDLVAIIQALVGTDGGGQAR